MSSFARAIVLSAAFTCAVGFSFADPAANSAKIAQAAEKARSGDAAAKKSLQTLISEVKEGSPMWDEALTVHQAASAAYDMKQLDIATSMNDRTIMLDPNNPRYLAFQSRLRMETGNLKGAEESAALAMKADPKSMYSLRAHGIVSVELGKLDEGEKAFLAMAEVAPADPLPPEMLGEIYGAKGEWAKSAEYLEKSLATGTIWPHAHVGLGRAYLELGKHDLARKNLELYLAKNPGSRGTLEMLVLACEKLGDTKAKDKYAAELAAAPPATATP